MSYLKADLKDIEKLADKAFRQHLISGYGTGEYDDGYQIVYKGKPRHLSIEQAKTFLRNLLRRQTLNTPNN